MQADVRPRACSDHHGRQRPLGEGARPAAAGRPSRRRRGAAQDACVRPARLGIDWLTVYAFSSENWSRPKSEVSDLMGLLKLFIRRDLAELHQNGVKVRVIGDRSGLQRRHQGAARRGRDADRAQPRTEPGHRLQLWRPRRDRAGRPQARRGGRGRACSTPTQITPESLPTHLDTAGIPDPDLVIRTSGEMRLSNFLLWQAAYSEFVFLPCFWPDFSRDRSGRGAPRLSPPASAASAACRPAASHCDGAGPAGNAAWNCRAND